MNLITKKTDDAVNQITASWHKSVASLLETAQLLLNYSLTGDWIYIQKELSSRNIMKSSVISMMLGIAQNEALNNPKNRNNLPPAYNTLYLLSQFSQIEIENRIASGEITPSVKLDEVRGWKSSTKITKKNDLTLLKIDEEDFTKIKSKLLPELQKLKQSFPTLILRGF